MMPAQSSGVALRARMKRMSFVTSKIMAAALVTTSVFGLSAALADPQVVDQKLPAYNEVWTSKSTGITGSMPIGNGTQAANVWVEGNTLKLLLSAGDAWDQNVRLAKLGRLNITFTPNPFASGDFKQELKLKEGEIVITSGSSPAITTRIWAGADEQTLHIESNASSAFSMKVSFDNLRPANVTNPPRNNFTFYDLVDSENGSASPYPPLVTADTVYARTDKLLWAHRNGDSRYDEIMTHQLLDQTITDDPLTGRTFGGLIQGPGFTPTSSTELSSGTATSQRLDITLHSEIDKTANWLTQWENNIAARADTSANTAIATLRSAHQTWWNDFWNRSYIFATGDADASRVTKGWLHARFVQAAAGRTPAMPIRFNGSLFTPGRTDDADFRMWNSYHAFNQRFAYWGMLSSGDFDMMQPFFDLYVKSLPLAKQRVEKFWGAPSTATPFNVQLPATQGAMWPEVLGLWGHAVGGEYGWTRSGNPASWFSGSWTRFLYAGNVELVAMMLDHYDYTQDANFVATKLLPVAREVVTFYDTHWNLKSGKIDMYPMYSGEADRGLHNPMADTAGLHRVVNGLLALPLNQTTSADRAYWTAVKGRLPVLPIGSSVSDNDTVYGASDRMKTASDLVLGTDTNNQNLWPIFPLRMFSVGSDNLDLAVASYQGRRGKFPTDGSQDWRHDATHAAYLGLTAEARSHTVSAFRAGAWRYAGFGPGAGDGEPGQEPPAIAKIALQAMLLQPMADGKAILFNAWPSNWDVDFKLRAVGGRTVEGSRVGAVADVEVTPGGAENIILRNPHAAGIPTTHLWAANPAATALAGDVNNDGKDDVVAWEPAGGVYVRYGDGTGQFGSETAGSWTGAGQRFAGDVNGDGRLDLITRDGGTWTTRIGDGSGQFAAGTTYTWNANPAASFFVSDVSGDGNVDLVAWEPEPGGRLYVRYGDGAGGFGNQTMTIWSVTSATRLFGDFNGDGKADIAVWTPATSSWSVRNGNGDGTFATAVDRPGGDPTGRAPLAADIDGDGRDDLATWTSSAGTWSVRYNLL